MKLNIIEYLAIIVVCFFAFFINNNVIPADIMEARNLATAQEMVSSGNYIIPTMNGELRLEKPPLPTWIAAGVEHIVPRNLAAQRCAAGFAATLMVFFLLLIVKKLTGNDKLAFIAALVLATTYSVIFMGRNASWDIYCHSFMLGSIYFLISAIEGRRSQWGLFLLAGIFMGLSFLSKGPVSFYTLLLPFLVSYIFVCRPRLKRTKIIALVTMIIVCLVVSFWWPTFIALMHPETAKAVAAKESGAWIGHSVRPFWYYWKFPVEAGIWTFFWIASLVYYFCKKNITYKNIYKLSIIWLFVSLVLLSLIPEKKSRYLLPILIPGAINIAFYIYSLIRDYRTKSDRIIFRLNSSLIALILLVLPIALYILFIKQHLLGLPSYILLSIVFLALSASILFSVFRKNIRIMTAVYCIVATMMAIEILLIPLIGAAFLNNDRRSIRLIQKDERVEKLPFYHNKDEQLRMELMYEANRIIRPIDVDSISYKLPLVFVSGLPIHSLLDGKGYSITIIDTFDNNWLKPGEKRYNYNLVREVAIIRAANDSLK